MNRFEFKLMDGLANPYLALSAILAAGLDGLEKETPLLGGPCDQAYAHLRPEEQKALGITTMLPKTLKDSLAALEANSELGVLLGLGMVSAYAMVKRGEVDSLRAMPDDARKAWLISRY